MRSVDVRIGGRYYAKVSNCICIVRITEPHIESGRHGKGWDAVNEETGRTVYIKTARRLRGVVGTDPKPVIRQ